jgi:acetyltransferase-like isoleucine patch superfamily enzyme
VILNSINNSYHVLLHSRVKLMADRKGAVIKIGNNTRIHGSCLHAYEQVRIGQNCLVAANCNIIDGNAHDLSFPHVEMRHKTKGGASPVIIEDNVWIGTNAIVLPGTHIGYGSVVSAASVVRGQIPPYCLVGGNPAKIIKRYSANGTET